MTFDWDEFEQMSDAEKVAYMRRYREAAREASKGRTLPEGSIAPEKARHQDGWEVVGRMKPDGTIHYYTEEEKQAQKDRFADNGDEDNEK